MTTGDHLEGLEKVTEIIKIVLASGSISDDKPLSLFIKAPVSSGKTTAVKQFQNVKKTKILTDITAYGILKTYQKDLENGEIRHFFIADLLNALSRRKTTAETLLLFINATSEDGLFPSTTFNIDIKNFIAPFGWILCITEEGFEKKKRFIESVGLSSRFLKISYRYSREQLDKILENIVNGRGVNIPLIPVKQHNHKKKIAGNVTIFKELIPYSKLLSKSDAEILRIQKQLQTFLKASALLRGDDKVQKEDLEKLKDLIELLK